MSKSPIERDDARVFCVLELVHVPKSPGAGITAVLSIPGREGTFQRTWHAPHGLLDEKQVTDLRAWVDVTVSNALVKWTGVQLVL